MRRLWMLFGAVLAVAAVGCSTMRLSSNEHKHRYSRQIDIENRQMVEDIDAFWLADRPSRLTGWQIR